MKNRLNTEIEIKDYDKYREIPISNVIAILKIYNVYTKNWKYYYFRKSWRSPQNISSIKLYQGSSQGNNEPSEEIKKDYQYATRIEYEILYCNLPSDQLGFFEKLVVMKHNFPLGGIKSSDCYNKVFPIGIETEQDMRSYIQKEDLKKKIEEHKHTVEEKGNSFSGIFKYKFLNRKNLDEKLNMDRVIQARLKEAGNSDTIHNYKDKMEQCPNPKEWDFIYVIEKPRNIEEGKIKRGNDIVEETILEGTQSSTACTLVKKMKGLYAYIIPYESVMYMTITDLEEVGNDFNGRPEKTQDFVAEDDFKKNIRKKLKKNSKKKNGKYTFLPMNHLFISSVFEKHPSLSLKNKERIYKSVINELKKEHKEEKAISEGSYDFREKGLKSPINADAEKKVMNLFVKHLEKEYSYKLPQEDDESYQIVFSSDGVAEESGIQKALVLGRNLDKPIPKVFVLCINYLTIEDFYKALSKKKKIFEKLIKTYSKVFKTLIIFHRNPSKDAIKNKKEWLSESILTNMKKEKKVVDIKRFIKKGVVNA